MSDSEEISTETSHSNNSQENTSLNDRLLRQMINVVQVSDDESDIQYVGSEETISPSSITEIPLLMPRNIVDINEQLGNSQNAPSANNALEEGEILEDVNESSDSPECCVCYNKLKKDENHIKTLCNHDYCRKCFFRWMEVKTTCAMCRKSFCTHAHLSNEEIEMETRETYRDYIKSLNLFINASDKLAKIEKDKYNANLDRDILFRSQLSLKEMSEYTKGYINGYYEYSNEKIQKLESLGDYLRSNNIHMNINNGGNFQKGYMLGRIEVSSTMYDNGKREPNEEELQ